MKILEILEHTIPSLAGYTVRSNYIIQNFIEQGNYVSVISSPFQKPLNQLFQNKYEIINNIKYYRTYIDTNSKDPNITKIFKRLKIFYKYKSIINMCCRLEKPDFIHAHSSYFNGYPAIKIAKTLKIPLCYEIRGFRADTETINEGLKPNSWKYRLTNYLEYRTASKSDCVVAISEGIKNELVKNGVNKEKIFIIPNGVDSLKFSPVIKSTLIEKKYNLNSYKIIGFIGMIRKIEGLSLAIKSLPQILEKKSNVKFMLVGSGDEVKNLKNLVNQLGIQHNVIFCGKVPHEKVKDYYSVIDILIYPRIDARVNHMVTPLKPLEAMSMKKVILASDVGGLKELIDHEKTGYLFRRNNKKDFVKKSIVLLNNDEFCRNLGHNARDWVKDHRDWSKIVKRYDQVYQYCLKVKK
ncbi:Glycosyltransferase, exosortase A system-associated [Candidatus Magnetomoraceae bacterium gMMP-1]